MLLMFDFLECSKLVRACIVNLGSSGCVIFHIKLQTYPDCDFIHHTSMHTPTLLTMLTVLLGIMSLGLFVARRFNPWIPGFNKWVLAYVFAFLSSLALSLGPTWLSDVQLSFSSNFLSR